jgi:hypothetical protein
MTKGPARAAVRAVGEMGVCRGKGRADLWLSCASADAKQYVSMLTLSGTLCCSIIGVRGRRMQRQFFHSRAQGRWTAGGAMGKKLW